MKKISLNRKRFISNVIGLIIGGFSISTLADIENAYDNQRNQTCKAQDYEIFCRFLAERYVDDTVAGPFKENGQLYFSCAPAGYLRFPDKSKKIIVVPSSIRRIVSDHYNVYAREKMIQQLQTYLIENESIVLS